MIGVTFYVYITHAEKVTCVLVNMRGIFTFTDMSACCSYHKMHVKPEHICKTHKCFSHREQTTYTVNTQGGRSMLGNNSANIFWEGNIRKDDLTVFNTLVFSTKKMVNLFPES